jgi:hypothetical protein
MKNIRIGNDIVVTWSIHKDGKPYALDGVEISLYLSHAFGKTSIEDFSITDNKIVWTFEGKEQKYTGNYSLELVMNQGQEGMATTDKIDFVRLVPVTPCCEGEDDENIVTEHVDLTSSMEFAPVIIKEGGSGLQYAVERTVYPNRMIYYGEDVDEPIELPEEQKAYNIETADMYHNGNDVFISFASFFFHPVVVAEDGSDGSWIRVGFSTLLSYEGEIDLLSVTITADGNATFEVKKFETGSATPSDMNSDFNNDF